MKPIGPSENEKLLDHKENLLVQDNGQHFFSSVFSFHLINISAEGELVFTGRQNFLN